MKYHIVDEKKIITKFQLKRKVCDGSIKDDSKDSDNQSQPVNTSQEVSHYYHTEPLHNSYSDQYYYPTHSDQYVSHDHYYTAYPYDSTHNYYNYNYTYTDYNGQYTDVGYNRDDVYNQYSDIDYAYYNESLYNGQEYVNNGASKGYNMPCHGSY